MACDAATLVEQAKCIACQIPPNLMDAVEIPLLCDILANGGGGGGGGGGVLCGAVAPTTAPTGTCGLYYGTGAIAGQLWSWDGAAWQQMIA